MKRNLSIIAFVLICVLVMIIAIISNAINVDANLKNENNSINKETIQNENSYPSLIKEEEDDDLSNNTNINNKKTENINIENDFNNKDILLYSFEESENGWSGKNITGLPSYSSDWFSNGKYSLKADIELYDDKYYYVEKLEDVNLSDKTFISANVAHSNRGYLGTGLFARIFVIAGENWIWYGGDETEIDSDTKTLTMDLSNIEDLNNVRSIGIQFMSGKNTSGNLSVYVDNVIIK